MIKIYNNMDYITIDYEKGIIFFNDNLVENLKYIEIVFLYNICINNHSILTYDDIRKDIIDKYNPFIYDIVPYVRKLKHNICKSLKKSGASSVVIETVSKIGYRLHFSWSLVENFDVSLLLLDLKSIIYDTLNILNELHIIKVNINNEIKTIANKEFKNLAIKENLFNFSKINDNILKSLNLGEYEFKYLQIFLILQEIKSYIAFERIGGDIEENDWKSYFKKELLFYYKKLLSLIN